jgi:hypothetical protein
MNSDLMRKPLAQAELATRDAVVRYAAEAREQGRKREAIRAFWIRHRVSD